MTLAKIRHRFTNTVTSLMGSTHSTDGAWIDADVLQTPREARLRRAAQILLWGAIAQAVITVLLIALTLFGVNLRELLLLNFRGTPEAGLLVLVVGIGVNLGFVLALAVAVQAQEFWTLPLLGILVLGNAVALLFMGFVLALVTIIPCGWAGYVLLPELRTFHVNPVASKELRGRMRGVRAFAIITIFLTMMGSFTVLLYLLQIPTVLGGRTIITGELGRVLFSGVFAVELLMIIFIVPALTAGAVSGERERKTFDLLQTTLLSAPSFMVGKLESALGYIVLLLLSAIPLQSIAFLFGGVSEIEIVLSLAILISTAFILGALGLFFSAQTDRTLTATIRVYTVAMAICGGITLLAIIYSPFGRKVAGLNVVAASGLIETLLIYADMLLMSLNPFTAAHYTQQMLTQHQQVFVLNVQLTSTGAMIPVIAPWLLLTVAYFTFSALLILLAIWRMRRTGE